MYSSHSFEKENSASKFYGYKTPRRQANTTSNAFTPWNPFTQYSPRNVDISYGSSLSDIYEPKEFTQKSRTFNVTRTPKKRDRYTLPLGSRKIKNRKNRRRKEKRNRGDFGNDQILSPSSPQTGTFFYQTNYWGPDSSYVPEIYTAENDIDSPNVTRYGFDPVFSESTIHHGEEIDTKTPSPHHQFDHTSYEEIPITPFITSSRTDENIDDFISIELQTLKKKRIRELKKKKMKKRINKVVKFFLSCFCIGASEIEEGNPPAYSIQRESEFISRKL